MKIPDLRMLMYKLSKAFVSILLLPALFGIEFSYGQAVKTERRGVGYGIAAVYNFHSGGFGVDGRIKLPLARRLSFVPQVTYFPSFNDYHDMFAGAALHYEIARLGSYNLYLLGGGYYHYWMNALDFSEDPNERHNFAYGPGAGLVRSYGCIRPFIENGYDLRWRENSLRIGIYIYPGSCLAKEKCPAYDN